MRSDTLKRYTELPFVLQALHSRTLTLLSPDSWDDENDAYYVNLYRKKKKLKTVLAACLTKADQTYHHWKVFTHGASGVCICFHKDSIDQWVQNNPELSGRMVSYKSINELENANFSTDDLPYIKREAYRHEDEFRILYEGKDSKQKIKSFQFDLNMIERIVINPWLPKDTFQTLKKVINGISGCNDIAVLHASIIRSDRWKQIADNALLLEEL